MTEMTGNVADKLRAKFRTVPHHHVIHMPGEKPVRSANDIEIHLTLDQHFFQAFVPDRYVDCLVLSWSDFLALAKKQYSVHASDRDMTKDILRDMLVEDEHLQAFVPDQPGNGPAIMASGVLWMVFSPTNPIAEIARIYQPRMAGYDITKLSHNSYNWRQVMAG
jgi:hypothetical protein